MGARNNTEKEESAIAKRVKEKLAFNVNSSNTDRPVNPTVDTNKSLSRNNSAEESAEMMFPSVTTHNRRTKCKLLKDEDRSCTGFDYK